MTFADVLDQVIGLVRQLRVQQHVAGQKFAFRIDLLAAAHFDHFFRRNEDIFDEVRQVPVSRPDGLISSATFFSKFE